MHKNITSFMIIIGNTVLAATFYGISALAYGWFYTIPSPTTAPFRFSLPEIRPIMSLYWALPPYQAAPMLIFIVMHTLEALLLFFIATTITKYILRKNIQITQQCLFKGTLLFFGASLAHVLLNGAIIYTLLSFTGYGALIACVPLFFAPILCIILSAVITPIALLFLFLNFFATASIANTHLQWKNLPLNLLSPWWRWSYALAFINCINIPFADILFRATTPSIAFIAISLYMGIITVGCIKLVCSWLKEYPYPPAPSYMRQL